jgi:hypothetical protein
MPSPKAATRGSTYFVPEAAMQNTTQIEFERLTHPPAKKSSRPSPIDSTPHNRHDAGQQSQIRECSHGALGSSHLGAPCCIEDECTLDFQMGGGRRDAKIGQWLTVIVQQRRRMPYNTISNKTRTVKTPGGQLRALHLKKRGTAPKCMAKTLDGICWGSMG